MLYFKKKKKKNKINVKGLRDPQARTLVRGLDRFLQKSIIIAAIAAERVDAKIS